MNIFIELNIIKETVKMDTFLKIDWNPSLNDILDDVFINEERLIQESAMYKILRGNFKNPFDNMEEDYNAVDIDAIMDDQNNLEANKRNLTGSSITSNVSDQDSDDKKAYVPGLKKPPFKFPWMSDLIGTEQAKCLRILLKFSGSEKPDLTDEDREDLQTYMRLKETINAEQDRYSEFVKEKWDGTGLQIYCEDYINSKWKFKVKNTLKLPRYYVECTNIPFTLDKEVIVQHISSCLEEGFAPLIKLPTFTRPYILRINSRDLEKRFPVPDESSDQSSRMHFKLPVSQDPTCQSLAEENEVDLVISSSGLNCLANNVGPSYTNTWILPVIVKSHNGKNIIYVDKPGPPTYSTIPEKNSWVYKYILKNAMIQLKPFVSERSDSVRVYDENLFGDIYSEDHVNLEGDKESEISSKTKTRPKFVNERATHKIGIPKSESGHRHIFEEEICDLQEQFGEDDNKAEKIENNVKTSYENVSYKLFKIGPSSTEQNELMKNTIKDYKILVRTKEDGYEKLTKTTQQKLLLAPKLEHQIALGAEAVTLEEALKQWISLLFRPGTCLARVRISAQSSEVIQIEKRTTISINNEIKRLYNVRAEDSLIVLYNVIQTLSNITPGQYVIRHTVRNGAFATVYKETSITGKNTLDLHTIYGYDRFNTIPNPPWPVLDKVVVTPMHKCFQRMPLMFYAPKERNNRRFKKNRPKASKNH